MNDEEKIWLDQARNGDKVAFGKLVDAYQRPVYNLAYRMLSNPGEAEEAAQEAFIRAYTRLDTYDPSYKFSTWLLSITSNYCIDLIRKRRALLLSIDEPLPPHPSLHTGRAKGPEARMMQDERQQLVQSLLETLPPDYRQAVVLHYWHDMPYQQIADVMDTTVSAVKSRLFRARRKLAEAGADVGLAPATEETAVPG